MTMSSGPLGPSAAASERRSTTFAPDALCVALVNQKSMEPGIESIGIP